MQPKEFSAWLGRLKGVRIGLGRDGLRAVWYEWKAFAR